VRIRSSNPDFLQKFAKLCNHESLDFSDSVSIKIKIKTGDLTTNHESTFNNDKLDVNLKVFDSWDEFVFVYAFFVFNCVGLFADLIRFLFDLHNEMCNIAPMTEIRD